MRLGNGNESDSSAPTIRLATLIRGARTAAGGERARILGVGASTAASTPGDVLGSYQPVGVTSSAQERISSGAHRN